MGLVRGEDVLLTVLEYNGIEYTYLPFACARSITFDISTDFIETSVTESGSFKTFIPSGKQFSGNIEGLVFLNKRATGGTRATTTVGYNPAYNPYFPNDGTTAVITVVDPNYGSIVICNVVGGYVSYEQLVDAMVADINGNSFNYTAQKIVIGSNIDIKIYAPYGYGTSINDNSSSTEFNFDGTILYNNSNFAGGTNSYYPPKLGIGWMYEKIISGEKIRINYHEQDDENNFLQKNCFVYIESINETASFDNMVTFSATFKGDGTPTINYGQI